MSLLRNLHWPHISYIIQKSESFTKQTAHHTAVYSPISISRHFILWHDWTTHSSWPLLSVTKLSEPLCAWKSYFPAYLQRYSSLVPAQTPISPTLLWKPFLLHLGGARCSFSWAPQNLVRHPLQHLPHQIHSMKTGSIPSYLCISAPHAGLAQSCFNKHYERNKGMSSKDTLSSIHVRSEETGHWN